MSHTCSSTTTGSSTSTARSHVFLQVLLLQTCFLSSLASSFGMTTTPAFVRSLPSIQPLPRSPLSVVVRSSSGDDSSSSGGSDGTSEFFQRLFKGAGATSGRRDNASPFVPPPEQPTSSAWARLTPTIDVGTILVANPTKFLQLADRSLSRQFLVPVDATPAIFGENYDSLANNCLPVILLTGHDGEGHTGLILNRRSGLLLGDVAENSSGFKIQPLLLGGITPLVENREPGVQGFTMIHPYAEVEGAKQMTNDGLYLGGDYTMAGELVREGRAMSQRFRFFLTKTRWEQGTLAEQIKNKLWFTAEVSREVLLTNRGREGTKLAKPLWTEVMDLLGGPYKNMKDSLYTGQL